MIPPAEAPMSMALFQSALVTAQSERPLRATNARYEPVCIAPYPIPYVVAAIKTAIGLPRTASAIKPTAISPKPPINTSRIGR